MRERFAACDAILHGALDRRFTAAVARVEIGGRLRFERAYGRTRDDVAARRISVDTRFDLASLTKLVVAALAIDAVARTALSLDEPLGNYMREWRDNERNDITLRQLLAHTSGMHSGAHYRNLFDSSIEDFALRHELQAPAGERVVYSDLGFIALGVLLARIEGRSLAESIARFASRPTLGYRPRFVDALDIVATECEAWRGRVQGSVHDEKAHLMGGVAGHAGLFGTAADAAWIGEEFLGALSGRPSRMNAALAREATREQAYDPVLRRGLGWALKTRNDNSCGASFSNSSFGHTGFVGTCIWVDPERDLTAVLLTNTLYYGRDGSTDLRRAVFESIANGVDAGR
ncbi:MAG TPA: serine hydrolase domain-containing protein [Candidatus Dormibacteraeota bacterium]|nr:serine hydrolase domain-containing protein [Candidatus Dormibacteraeota bacterium]